MKTLNLEQIIKENPTKTNKELAIAFNVSIFKISAKRSWIEKGIKSSAPTKKVGTLRERKNSLLKDNNELTETISKKTKKGTFKDGGANKIVARGKMKKHIVESNVIGEVPTLPNENWKIEESIANEVPEMTFIGAEREIDIYETMCANLKNTNLKAKTHFGNIGDLIYGKLENTYAHLILDYCGHLSTFSKEIEYVINNDILKMFGIMAITFGKPLRGIDKQTLKIKGLAPTNNGDTRCVSDRAIENYFAKITGWNYEVKEIFYYTDKKESGKGYPMTLVIIQRIK